MTATVKPCPSLEIEQILVLEQKNSTRPYTLAILKELFETSAVILKIEENEQTLGYVIASIVFEDGEIINIVIDKSAQNRGLGKLLLDSAIKECIKKGATRVLLEVEETNLPALKLYQKSGFKQISTRPNYYGQNAAIIMEYSAK